MRKLLLIIYFPGSSGMWLEYFLTNHNEIVPKGIVEIEGKNEYFINYGNKIHDRWMADRLERKKLIDQVKNMQSAINRDGVTHDIRNFKYITFTSHIWDEDKENNWGNKEDTILLGIGFTSDDLLRYIKRFLFTKHNSKKPMPGLFRKMDQEADDFVNRYRKQITTKNIPSYIINYNKFFKEQDVNEYINLCKFLKIIPDIEMYKKAIGYYMYMNYKLCKEIPTDVEIEYVHKDGVLDYVIL